MRYDESDHIVVRGSRVVTDRVVDTFSGVMNQSDMAQALAEIKKIDRNFDKEKFIRHCRYDIIPTVLEVSAAWRSCDCHVTASSSLSVQAYVRGDLEVLKDWCHEAVQHLSLNTLCSGWSCVRAASVLCRHSV